MVRQTPGDETMTPKIPITPTKIVINRCFGGFSLSEEACNLLNTKRNKKENDEGWVNPEYGYLGSGIERYNKDLVTVVEELGIAASGGCADLTVETIEGYRFRISEYDGNETLETPESDHWDIVDSPEARVMFPEFFL